MKISHIIVWFFLVALVLDIQAKFRTITFVDNRDNVIHYVIVDDENNINELYEVIATELGVAIADLTLLDDSNRPIEQFADNKISTLNEDTLLGIGVVVRKNEVTIPSELLIHLKFILTDVDGRPVRESYLDVNPGASLSDLYDLVAAETGIFRDNFDLVSNGYRWDPYVDVTVFDKRAFLEAGPNLILIKPSVLVAAEIAAAAPVALPVAAPAIKPDEHLKYFIFKYNEDDLQHGLEVDDRINLQELYNQIAQNLGVDINNIILTYDVYDIANGGKNLGKTVFELRGILFSEFRLPRVSLLKIAHLWESYEKSVEMLKLFDKFGKNDLKLRQLEILLEKIYLDHGTKSANLNATNLLNSLGIAKEPDKTSLQTLFNYLRINIDKLKGL